MANDSRANLKMLFSILTDKEIEELEERAIRQRNFYAANLCGGKQISDPSRWRSQFHRRSCAAKTLGVKWGVAASSSGANVPVGSHPSDGAND